jgi:hypothetical protein
MQNASQLLFRVPRSSSAARGGRRVGPRSNFEKSNENVKMPVLAILLYRMRRTLTTVEMRQVFTVEGHQQFTLVSMVLPIEQSLRPT